MFHLPDLAYLDLITAAAIGAAIFVALLGLKMAVRRFAEGLGRGSPHPSLIADVTRKTRLWFLAILAARLTARYVPLPEDLTEIIAKVFIVAAVLQVALWAIAFILGLVERRANSDNGEESNLTSALGLIRLLVSVAIFIIAGVVILDNLGIDVTGLIAGLGIGGIAIGLAAQGIFSDLFAALSIIFDKPFKVGDTINYNGAEGLVTGKVEEIGLKSTRVRSLTGELRIIGNSQLLAQEVTNFAGRSLFRFHLPVGVTYQTPPDVADSIPQLMQELVENAGHRFIRANFTGFGASSIDFEAYFEVDTESVVEAQKSYQAVSLDVLRQFNERGIEFAYPTQTNFTAAPDGTMVMPYAAEAQTAA